VFFVVGVTQYDPLGVALNQQAGQLPLVVGTDQVNRVTRFHDPGGFQEAFEQFGATALSADVGQFRSEVIPLAVVFVAVEAFEFGLVEQLPTAERVPSQG